MISRDEFVKEYAQRSGLSDEFAEDGMIEKGNRTLICLPCGCEEEDCQGWAMLSPRSVLSHLALKTPGKMRDAYIELVGKI